MYKVFPQHVDEKKAAAGLEKLVSAFLAVAEDIAAQERLSGESRSPDTPQVGGSALATGPSEGIVARSKGPEQGPEVSQDGRQGGVRGGEIKRGSTS